MAAYRIQTGGIEYLYRRLVEVANEVHEDLPVAGGPDGVLSEDDMVLWLKDHTAKERNLLAFDAVATDGRVIRFSSRNDLSVLYKQLYNLDRNDGKLDGTINDLSAEIFLEGSPEKTNIAEVVRPFMRSVFRYEAEIRYGESPTGTVWVVDREPISDGGWRYYCLSNAHVVDSLEEEKDRLLIDIMGNRIPSGRLIGIDRSWDIGVLSFESREDLPLLPLAEAADVKTGDHIALVGNQKAYGIVLMQGRINHPQKFFPRDNLFEWPFPMIQHDANAARGTSGSPLFNERGEVIGMEVASIRGDDETANMKFAIPVDLVKRAYHSIRATGFNIRGGPLEVELSDLSPKQLTSIGVTATKGFLINSVVPGSRAERAGLRAGGILLSVDGKSVSDWASRRAVHYAIDQKKPGEVAGLEIAHPWTDERQIVEYRIESFSEPSFPVWQTPFGFVVMPLEPNVRSEVAAGLKPEERDLLQGVVAVWPGRVPEGAVRDYSIVTAVNGRPVSSTEDFQKIIEEGKEPYYFQVIERQDHGTFAGKRAIIPAEVKDPKKQESYRDIAFENLSSDIKNIFELGAGCMGRLVTFPHRYFSEGPPILQGDVICDVTKRGPLSSVPVIGPIMGLFRPYYFTYNIRRNGQNMSITMNPPNKVDVLDSPYSIWAVNLANDERTAWRFPEGEEGVAIGTDIKNHPYGIETGMFVTRIDGRPVKSAEDIQIAAQQARREQKLMVWEVSGSLAWKHPGYKKILFINAHEK